MLASGSASLVEVEPHGGVAVVSLHNLPANTYSHAMMRELDEAILALRADDGCEVIVVRGAGERFFCAGADIDWLAGAGQTEKYYFCLHANETLLRLEHTPKLVIAALNGHTVGGGLEIALAADLRIAARGAGKIGLPEVSLGVLPGTGGTQRLARTVGKAKALELMVTGATFDFETAVGLGLVTAVLEPRDFMAQVLDYARRFTTPTASATAVGAIKRAVVTGAELPLEAGLTLERELQARLFAAPDAAEGLDAYREKRTARFGS